MFPRGVVVLLTFTSFGEARGSLLSGAVVCQMFGRTAFRFFVPEVGKWEGDTAKAAFGPAFVAEGVGFEPTKASRPSGFQVRAIRVLPGWVVCE